MRGRIRGISGLILKNGTAASLPVIALGILIALGPQFLFKVCAHGEDSFPRCYWTARAEIGAGALIACLGLSLALFREGAQGLRIALFFAGVLSLSLPHALTGGCGMMSMRCRRVAFPWLTAVGLAVIVYSAVTAVYIQWQKERRTTAGP
jgi:hypothetical protein